MFLQLPQFINAANEFFRDNPDGRPAKVIAIVPCPGSATLSLRHPSM